MFEPAAFLQGASNAEALLWLQRVDAWPGRRLAVIGPPGSGKTHLLHLWAARSGAGWLAGEALRGLLPVPQAGALAIDDADALAEEEALLHLLNAAAEARLPVLLSARTPPARWPVQLPDLASRLRAITAVRLGRPDDDLRGALLARLLGERQLAVPEALQRFLLARLPRSGAALREAAARLDRLALAAGGGVTRALAAQVAAELAEDDPQ